MIELVDILPFHLEQLLILNLEMTQALKSDFFCIFFASKVGNILSFKGSKEPMMLEISESSKRLMVFEPSPLPPGSVKDPDIVSTSCCGV